MVGPPGQSASGSRNRSRTTRLLGTDDDNLCEQ